MKIFKRVFLIVLDSFGIGAAPDAADFGDVGANTLRGISSSEYFSADNLIKLGLSHIDGVTYLEKKGAPLATVARLTEKSRGKDTTIGHWELMGIVSDSPLPTYPNGFPEEIIREFEKRTGRKVLCNLPYSGTQVIEDYGREHLKSGDLIVYTSADSVFQIAAHEAVVPVDELYGYCRTAREILTGEHSVGRVIARPFSGEPGSFKRTADRRDFSLRPPKGTTPDKVLSSGKEVIAVGKITDIFAGCGISNSILTHSNKEGMQITEELLSKDFEGLVFTNLVEFDSHYGHRQDADGYAAALSAFDGWLGEFLPKLSEDDALIITADHGCDPTDESTDHTREYVPFLLYGKGLSAKNLGTLDSFAFAGKAVEQLLGIEGDYSEWAL